MSFLLSPGRKKFFDNFFNYTLFQASRYIVPFVTIPYIIHVLGVEKFGIISLAQGVANYIRVGVDYGWNILGVQYIAREADNKKEQGRILSTILFQQLLLSLLGLLLLGIGILLIPKYNMYAFVFFAAYGLVPGNMLMVSWYFVGMQQVKFLNRSFLLARFLYVILILILLKPLNNLFWVPVFNSGSLLLSGFINLFVIYKKFNIPFVVPSIKSIKQYFREGWHIFISYFSTNFYRNSNVIILGFFTSNYLLGIYSLAEKIIKVIQGTFMPLSQTLFPYIAKYTKETVREALPTVYKAGFIMGALALAMVFMLMFGAQWLVDIIVDKESPGAVQLIRIGSWVIFFGVMNYVLGILFMTNFGMKKEFSYAVIATGLSGVILSIILSWQMQARGAMYSFVIAEIFLFFLLFRKSFNFIRRLNHA